ncbi:MAG: hypothetical protein AAF382_17070 [Pseudomonadota bacterium]
MKHNHYLPGKQNPHLPHDGVEIEAKATDDETAQRNADLLVSQLMQGNTKPRIQSKPVASQSNASHAVAAQTAEHADVPQTLTRDATPAAPLEQAADTTPPAELTEEEIVRNVMREAFPPLKEEQAPTIFERVPPVYVVAVACGIIVLLWPTLLFWMLLTACLSLIAAAILMRIPGVAWLFARVWTGFARKAPERAERARKIADFVAVKVERMLDLLPGSLADRLSLPDFSQPVGPKR